MYLVRVLYILRHQIYGQQNFLSMPPQVLKKQTEGYEGVMTAYVDGD